jgi:hypothetical protein
MSMTLLSSRRRDGRSLRLRNRRVLPLESLERREVLSTITVTSLADSGPGTLREAITIANSSPSEDRIDFAPSVVGQITIGYPLPDLSGNLTVNGPGASILNVTRINDPGSGLFRIFTVADGAVVTMAGLTVSGGNANTGGGFLNSGTLNLNNMLIRDNQAPIRGGGIDNDGDLTITNSVIRDNRALIGGGIASRDGRLIVSNCVISGNENRSPYTNSSGNAGGIAAYGLVTIQDSVIRGNSSPNGFAGGLTLGGSCVVTGCTISDNVAKSSGGGVVVTTGGVTLTNVTITRNSAPVGGGMIIYGPTTVIDSTFADNRSATAIWLTSELTLQTTILDNPDGKNIFLDEGRGGTPQGHLISLGHNLFSDTPNAPLNPTDLVNTDPLLAPLADYGGPTETMALLPGSPAINAGVMVSGITTDQRGIPRPQGIAPDIGAFESQGFQFSVIAGDGQSATVGTEFAVPLVVALTTPDGFPIGGEAVTFAAPAEGASAALSDFTATTDQYGHATVRTTANGTLGSYTVTAQIAGLAAQSFTLTNTPVPPPPPTPTVDRVDRLGFHMRPTRIFVRFSAAMDAERAGNPANYRLVKAGRDGVFGTRDDRTIRLRGLRYDALAHAVQIAPRHRLPLHSTYQLTVNGTSPDGLTSAEGVYLGGVGRSQPGTDFVAIIDRGSLVRSQSKRKIMLLRDFPNHPARITRRENAVGNVARDHAPGTDDRT